MRFRRTTKEASSAGVSLVEFVLAGPVFISIIFAAVLYGFAVDLDTKFTLALTNTGRVVAEAERDATTLECRAMAIVALQDRLRGSYLSLNNLVLSRVATTTGRAVRIVATTAPIWIFTSGIRREVLVNLERETAC